MPSSHPSIAKSLLTFGSGPHLSIAIYVTCIGLDLSSRVFTCICLGFSKVCMCVESVKGCMCVESVKGCMCVHLCVCVCVCLGIGRCVLVLQYITINSCFILL